MPMSDVIAITFTGLVIVFCGLILLIAFVYILSMILKKSKSDEKPAPKTVSAPAPAPVSMPSAQIEDGISDEVIAVISAAIAAMSDSDNTVYAVRSIKKVAKVGRPVWAMAGLQENTRAF